ncbi:hypothetical protein H109_02002 [Trichophyton interdigitale MR816]|uniref:Uncharacterized protein n=1 Tax=Trichophyton interdigitale (strain MR816) TaxID=1215338 RepID=A0A059JEI1_TRIIM|nr:hypothetical protein H109_02002 [Trichophyton interdigitale MR816]
MSEGGYIQGAGDDFSRLISVCREGLVGRSRNATAWAVDVSPIFGLKKAGWSVVPALTRELDEIYDRIMQQVRTMRSEATRVGGMARARQIAGNQWLYEHNVLPRRLNRGIAYPVIHRMIEITVCVFTKLSLYRRNIT